MTAKPVFILASTKQTPTALGLQKVAWSHQTHGLPVEELFRSAHQGRRHQRKEYARWQIYGLILRSRSCRNNWSSFTRKVETSTHQQTLKTSGTNIWIRCLPDTVSSEQIQQELTADVPSGSNLVPKATRSLRLFIKNNSTSNLLARGRRPPVNQGGWRGNCRVKTWQHSEHTERNKEQ